MNRTVGWMLAIGSILSGCAGGVSEADSAIAGFSNASSTSTITSGLSSVTTDTEFNSDGDGYRYASGVQSGDGLRARAGVIPTSDVTRTLTTGSVVMTGRWELTKIENIFYTGSTVSGTPGRDAASISLTADFAANTLTGSSSGLSVNGTFEGETLSGSVTYDGANGSLRGLVGDDEAIGAFHGEGNREIFAGGFVVEQ